MPGVIVIAIAENHNNETFCYFYYKNNDLYQKLSRADLVFRTRVDPLGVDSVFCSNHGLNFTNHGYNNVRNFHMNITLDETISTPSTPSTCSIHKYIGAYVQFN